MVSDKLESITPLIIPIKTAFAQPPILMTAAAPAPVKASLLHLDAAATTEEAFIAIISASLRHAEANRPAVLNRQIEGVHQMRVAFRRLRSGLSLFRPLIPRSVSAEWAAHISSLNHVLGPARDWDVFLEDSLSPLLQRFPRKRGLILFQNKAEIIRQGHYQALQDRLVEPAYVLFAQRLGDWLARCDWREALTHRQRARLAEPVLAFATPLLEHDYRRVVKQGRGFAEMSTAERHQLRIDIKKLRYALEFFASGYPAQTVKSLLGALSRLQDCLGVMNDITVTQRLLDEAGLTCASAARQVIEGWCGCRLDSQECQFAELWRPFMAHERPWQD